MKKDLAKLILEEVQRLDEVGFDSVPRMDILDTARKLNSRSIALCSEAKRVQKVLQILLSRKGVSEDVMISLSTVLSDFADRLEDTDSITSKMIILVDKG